MKIEHIEVHGLNASVRAMRNPMNSWDRSDSYIFRLMERVSSYSSNLNTECFILGEADSKLSANLTKAGGEHCKHLRMIQVWMDIEAPRYWWQEMDCYRFVEKVSCSTMHKLFERDLKLSDFECGEENGYYLVDTVIELNRVRKEFIKTKDKDLLIKAKRILPESFLQKRTINTNYQQLLNIYKQRKNHKLPEWKVLCKEIERLPYFKELVGGLD